MSLRSELGRITKELDIQKHPAMLTELSAKVPHTIAIVEQADLQSDFNCVMFALDLVGGIEPPCSPLGRYYMSTDFLEHLIHEDHIFQLESPEAGALAVYFRGGNMKHVGVVQANGRIRSKWGAGHLYEHDLWEVPDTLGDDVRYFSEIDPDEAFELFKEFHV